MFVLFWLLLGLVMIRQQLCDVIQDCLTAHALSVLWTQLFCTHSCSLSLSCSRFSMLPSSQALLVTVDTVTHLSAYFFPLYTNSLRAAPHTYNTTTPFAFSLPATLPLGSLSRSGLKELAACTWSALFTRTCMWDGRTVQSSVSQTPQSPPKVRMGQIGYFTPAPLLDWFILSPTSCHLCIRIIFFLNSDSIPSTTGHSFSVCSSPGLFTGSRNDRNAGSPGLPYRWNGEQEDTKSLRMIQRPHPESPILFQPSASTHILSIDEPCVETSVLLILCNKSSLDAFPWLMAKTVDSE